MENEIIKKQAEEFVKANKKRIAKELTDTYVYAPDDAPVSIFMAGSPGAGKTEYSKDFIKTFEKYKKRRMIRIDPDELRKYLPGYTGDNSSLFQKAISILVSEIHDSALRNRQTFLLDGTFSKYDKAVENINRSLSRSRQVIIFYVYQRPEIAWKFVEAREKIEGRNIPRDAFIQQFIDSRQTIDRIRKTFDDRVGISIVKKNFEIHENEELFEIKSDGRQIDYYLGVPYTKENVEKIL